MVTWLPGALWLFTAGLMLTPYSRRTPWLRLGVTALTTLLAWTFLATDSASPLRSGVALFVLLLGPGLAWIPLFSVRDALSEGVLVLTFSLVLSTTVSTLLVVTGSYTALTGFSIIAGFCFVGLFLQLIYRRPAQLSRVNHPSDPEVLSTP